jgi:high-affinity Fe2+/Pb2+ permease
VWLGTGIVFLLLVLWGPTHALRTLWGVVLLGALLSLGLWAFRRETVREFPASPAVAPAPAVAA